MRQPPLLLVGNAAESFRGPLRAGVRVFAGLHSEQAHFSSRVGRLPRAPEPWDDRFVPWLNRMATRLPGAVLMPNTDNMAWWLARHREELPKGFGPVAVGLFDAVRTAQVKSRLAAAAKEAGIATAATVLLDSPPGLSRAAEVGFPLVLKPQMRTGMHHWTRGRVVRNERELGQAWEQFRREVRFEQAVLADAPEAKFPLAQGYIRRRDHAVVHLAGFVARDGARAVACHRKLLQAPLRFGSGVCFERMPVDAEVSGRLLSLLQAIGYRGLFEAEFLPQGDELLLTDLNVRPYNGIGLELAAGLDLVTLAYLDALGEDDEVREALERFNRQPFRPGAWCHHAEMAVLTAGQMVSGGMPARRGWGHWRWAWENRGHMVNPFFSRDEPLVGIRQAGGLLLSPFTNPRGFLGTYVRRGLDR